MRLRVNTGPSEGVARSLFTGEENGDQVNSWTVRDSLPAQNINVVNEEQGNKRDKGAERMVTGPRYCVMFNFYYCTCSCMREYPVWQWACHGNGAFPAVCG